MDSSRSRISRQRPWTLRHFLCLIFRPPCVCNPSCCSLGGVSVGVLRISTHSCMLLSRTFFGVFGSFLLTKVRNMRTTNPADTSSEPRLLLLLAACDCPAQRQVSGERGPGSKFGCEKCHDFAWQDPAVQEARIARQNALLAKVRSFCVTLFPMLTATGGCPVCRCSGRNRWPWCCCGL